MTRWTVFVCVFAMAMVAGGQDLEENNNQFMTISIDQAVRVDPAEASEPSVVISFGEDFVRTQTVTVTELRQETRTRTVNVDGENVEQEYVVQVPVMKQVEQTVKVKARKPVTVAIRKVKAWNASGSEISDAELIDRLTSGTTAVMLPAAWPKGAKIQPNQLSVLREDVLFLYSDSVKQTRVRAPVAGFAPPRPARAVPVRNAIIAPRLVPAAPAAPALPLARPLPVAPAPRPVAPVPADGR